MTMILDNLQVSQYQYPEKSTIRELVSNAVDSTKEKFQALSILNGEKQESDFYIRRDGAMFKDSNFNPAYFNQKWLGAETQVQIIYEEGSQLERDKVRIIDQGVGLGGKRLEGYFKLGLTKSRTFVYG
jgi:K+-sensing histidine kinase KdpD